ncbi:MAG TPA: hypothetical protein VEL28_01885 [Candidatus Binatia bacterium]|nr:hypothetical protein [Candidatus Binatia bacterium]
MKDLHLGIAGDDGGASGSPLPGHLRRLAVSLAMLAPAVMSLPAPAAAQFETVYAQEKYSAETNPGLAALNMFARFGSSVTAIDDYNGNGIADLAVGAASDATVDTSAGGIWFVPVRTDASAFRLETDSGNMQANGQLGAAIDNFAHAISGAPPVAGATHALVVGSPGKDGTQPGQGAIIVMLVDATFNITETVITHGTGAFVTNPSQDEHFGQSVAVIGDIDGNGFADLAVGAPGIDSGGTDAGGLYILRLGMGASVIGATRIDAFSGLPGLLSAGDAVGSSVAGIGDVNGDGMLDVAVGSPLDDEGGTSTGSVRLLFLNTTGAVVGSRKITAGSVDFVAADGAIDTLDQFGAALAARDLTFDGDLELLVGAPGDMGVGAFWVLELSGIGIVEADRVGQGTNGFTGDLEMEEKFGASLAALDDFDNDGVREIAVGHPADDDGNVSGAVWILTFGECGDGTVDTGELCDDGNRDPGDCCTPACTGDDASTPCEDDFEACTFDHCDGLGSCLHDGIAGPCDDGAACNGTDQCDATNGTCTIHSDDFCMGGAECQTFCNAMTSSCADLAGTPCTPDANPCTRDECNGFGACAHLPDTFAPCNDGNPCTLGDHCNDAAECVDDDSITDGMSCDDGDACTQGTTCTFEVCGTGTAVDCSGLADDCNTAGCDPGTGCFADPVANGEPCDDDTNCTSGDTCMNGVCETVPVDCSGFSSDPCNPGICNEGTGTCTTEPAENNTLCDDGDNCTTDDVCTGGVCGGTPVDCSTFADSCNTAECNAGTGVCDVTPVMDGTGCDDDDNCTTTDVCTAGTCGGTPVDCSGSTDQCNSGNCNVFSGLCEQIPVGNGTGCNDGLACTTTDVCTDGTCGGTPVDCSGLDDACNEGVCDPGTGGCETSPHADGTPCEDGALCTLGDECQAGVCVSGPPKDCSSLDESCKTGTCNPANGECFGEAVPAGTPCNDGLACTVVDDCGSCADCAGIPKDCSSAGDQCNDGVCDPDSGLCEASPVADPTGCNDGLACTENDVCTGGVCAGTPTDCSGLTNQCSTGVCNVISGLCQAVPVGNGTGCNDGSPCTTDDVCSAGSCTGTPVDCSSAGDQCNTGSCNAVTGLCESRAVTDGNGCDDGLACTTGDVCTGGVCAGTAVDCSGIGDQCNFGACNSSTGLCETFAVGNGTGCNDGMACTNGDACTAGVCAGSAVDCSGFSDMCHTGVCNAGTGLCESVPVGNDVGCADGNPCTTDDVCTDGICGGTQVDCSAAGDQCNSGVCNPANGQCIQEPVGDGTSCDDGLFCTELDSCESGVCTGPSPCGDDPLCTGECNEALDECRTCGHPYSNSRCVVNAVFILQGAVGLRDCQVCFCDVNSNFQVTSTDAAAVLRTCVHLPQQLSCPTGFVLQAQ